MNEVILVLHVAGDSPARRNILVVPALHVDGVNAEELQLAVFNAARDLGEEIEFKRGGIVQFDPSSSALDPTDLGLVDKVFADRGGASYFFVVARGSKTGTPELELFEMIAQRLTPVRSARCGQALR